jgi:hypothetical protein
MKPSGTKEPANLEWDALVRALNGDEALARETIKRNPTPAPGATAAQKESQNDVLLSRGWASLPQAYRPPAVAP